MRHKYLWMKRCNWLDINGVDLLNSKLVILTEDPA